MEGGKRRRLPVPYVRGNAAVLGVPVWCRSCLTLRLAADSNEEPAEEHDGLESPYVSVSVRLGTV